MNISEILPLTRPLIFFDCETTGQEPKEDRIVSLAFIWYRPAQDPIEWYRLVNPGVPIPHEATYGNGAAYPGHGITDEMVKDAPTFADLAPGLIRGFHDCDYGGCSIRGFDLPLMRAEFERAGYPTWNYDDARVVDILRQWQHIDPRSLSDAHQRFLKEPMVGAHDALADIRATIRIAVAQFEECATLPRDIQALHELLYPKKKGAIDPQGQIVWRDGVATVNFGSKWRGKRLDLMTRRDLEWIVGLKCAGANSTTKQICKDALNGKFPVMENSHASTDFGRGDRDGGAVPDGVGGVAVPAGVPRGLFE